MGRSKTHRRCVGCVGPDVGPAPAAAAEDDPRLSFNKDIRPILSENCFVCHGPDNANRQAGLRLDTFELATQELESGSRAIVPEAIDESELIARVISGAPDSVMPPPEAKIGRLSAEQVETLKRWDAEGAKYEPHWAFVADTSPNAYERLLDRLLASPRYGERMAADWMDIARYSDSYGFQVDRPRPDMWPWRDWVITAFNENLPWDQFTVWRWPATCCRTPPPSSC